MKGMDMDHDRFDALARDIAGISRRAVLGVLAVSAATLAAPHPGAEVDARKRRKKKRRKTKAPTGPLCTSLGEVCAKPGSNCQERFCLRAPFTITATWSSQTNHDTWLFVPPQDGSTGPSPQIDYDCNQSNSRCAQAYPFACVNRDASGPGDEITTIHDLLPGAYEYGISLGVAPRGELEVILTDRDGRVVRSWTSPTVSSALESFWHVFDVDGTTGRVRSVDAPPARFPLPVTNVCPQ
jgi:hypothetical protein